MSKWFGPREESEEEDDVHEDLVKVGDFTQGDEDDTWDGTDPPDLPC